MIEGKLFKNQEEMNKQAALMGHTQQFEGA
jgi:hypothetical protein